MIEVSKSVVISTLSSKKSNKIYWHILFRWYLFFVNTYIIFEWTDPSMYLILPYNIVTSKKRYEISKLIRNFEFWDSEFKFVISDFKNPRVTVSKRIRAKLLMFYSKMMYLTTILDPPFWILRIWRQIRNQRLRKPLSESFQTELRTFRALFEGWTLNHYYMNFLFFRQF